MNKKWLIVTITLFVVIAIIGAGGKVYMDNRAEQKEAEKIEIERKSVEALKEMFGNIKMIEIEKTAYNKMTGVYSIFVNMTNDSNESVDFSYSFWEERKEVGSVILENEEVVDEGITKNKVRVIYSNNQEEDV